MKSLLFAVVAVTLAGCGRTTAEAPVGRIPRPTFEQLTAEPAAYDGRRIRIETGYLSSFELSVLTSGFAESYPPQSTPPEIWVEAAAPTGACVEEARGTTWAENVVATGRFVYRADGGLGHLGAYDMALEDAALACA